MAVILFSFQGQLDSHVLFPWLLPLLRILLVLGLTVYASAAAIVMLRIHNFPFLITFISKTLLWRWESTTSHLKILPSLWRSDHDQSLSRLFAKRFDLLKDMMDAAPSCSPSRANIPFLSDERNFVRRHTGLDQLFLNWTRLSAPRFLLIFRRVLLLDDDPVKISGDYIYRQWIWCLLWSCQLRSESNGRLLTISDIVGGHCTWSVDR